MDMSKKNVYFASIIGEILEWYDFSLYSFLSPVFVTLFFPKSHPVAGLLGVFAIFAAGFLSRPLGGLWFGWLGDKKGRKAAFFVSLSLMAIPTFLMGCLPTFQTIGFAAPIFLLLLRLLQGFSCGGEFSISMIFLSEHANKNNYYFSGCLAWLGVAIGALLASLVVTVISFHNDFLMQWGWRIPFFLGGIIAIAGIILRAKTSETPIFLALKKESRARSGRFAFLKKHKMAMLKIFVLNAPVAALSYVAGAFIATFLSKFVGVPLNIALMVNTSLFVGLIIFVPIFGKFADKVGGKKTYILALIVLILGIFPAYSLFIHSASLLAYVAAVLLITIPDALIKSVTPGISVQLAPLEERAVVMSVSYNITYCLLGGTAPLLMSYLMSKTQLLLFPAIYIAFFAVISLFVFIAD